AAQPVVERPQPAPSAGAPSPGSFGDKLAGAIGGIETALGEAAHAHDTRGGWLTGMMNTLAARKARLEAKRKDDKMLAKVQGETVAMHRNMYLQDKALNDEFQKHNREFVDTFRVNHDVEDGVTYDQLHERMAKDKNFANNYAVREIDSAPVLGPDGEQVKDSKG